jgi:uncharacterized protein YfaS (alpha-2-macroglobulin family)
VVFAVDEGILQVARYQPPDPLAFFFQKRSLDVRTSQILDMILPEFRKLMQAAAPGGDAERARSGAISTRSSASATSPRSSGPASST